MNRPIAPAMLLLAACGAQLSGASDDQDIPDGGLTDARPPDAWSPATRVTVAATSEVEDDVTLSPDALEMIFAVVTGPSTKDLYYTSRPSTTAAWAAVDKLPFDTASSEETPRFSGNGKALYFASDRVTEGDLDIYVVSHPEPGNGIASWGPPDLVPKINTSATEKWFAPCGTDRYVVVRSTTDDGTDLFEGTLDGDPPAPLTVLNSSANETGAFLTSDCLTIYFASVRNRPQKIYVSRRPTFTAPWSAPVPVDDFKITGGNGNQEDPWLSADGHTFAFASDASGDKDIYLSTR